MTGLVKDKKFKKNFQTLQEHSAESVGSGTLNVLSTPSMIAFMENTALMQINLPPGQTTVGCCIKTNHLKPTAIGKEVEIISTIEKIEGKFINYTIEAFVENQKIGDAVHQRVIIDTEKFLSKLF